MADQSSPHTQNKLAGKASWRESALGPEGCLRASSPIVFAHQQEKGFREKRQLPKTTSLSPAELGLTLPPRPRVPSALGSTARQGVGLREGLVLLHPQPILRTDGLFSFHMEGPRRIMPPKTAASTLELRPPAVHSRRSFAYHRLTDSTWPPHPAHLPIPNGRTAGLEAL